MGKEMVMVVLRGNVIRRAVTTINKVGDELR